MGDCRERGGDVGSCVGALGRGKGYAERVQKKPSSAGISGLVFILVLVCSRRIGGIRLLGIWDLTNVVRRDMISIYWFVWQTRNTRRKR